jgi:hypothetical protein
VRDSLPDLLISIDGMGHRIGAGCTVREVISVAVREDRAVSIAVRFDPERVLAERIIAEQFTAGQSGDRTTIRAVG